MVIEPAFGGSAQSWHAIAGTLGEQTTVVTYDRVDPGRATQRANGNPAGRNGTGLVLVIGGVLAAWTVPGT